MKILKQIWTLMASMVLITACTQDIPTVSLGIDDIYYLERMKSYKLTPAFTGQEYRWTMKTASGKDSLVSTESTYIFLQKDEGTYDMTFEIIDPVTPYKHDCQEFIVVLCCFYPNKNVVFVVFFINRQFEHAVSLRILPLFSASAYVHW